MAGEYIEPLQNLIDAFRKLPGIGGKSAARMAFAVLDFSPDDAQLFADAVLSAKEKIKCCKVCGNITTGEYCRICTDPERDRGLICVVEDAKDVMAFERVREYKGLYHVLGGALSPMNGVSVSDLRFRELLSRIEEGGVREVVVATNPTVEGEATAMYLLRLLEPYDVQVSRLAYGIPVGGDLEYADEVTLNRAMEGRRQLK